MLTVFKEEFRETPRLFSFFLYSPAREGYLLLRHFMHLCLFDFTLKKGIIKKDVMQEAIPAHSV